MSFIVKNKLDFILLIPNNLFISTVNAFTIMIEYVFLLIVYTTTDDEITTSFLFKLKDNQHSYL